MAKKGQKHTKNVYLTQEEQALYKLPWPDNFDELKEADSWEDMLKALPSDNLTRYPKGNRKACPTPSIDLELPLFEEQKENKSKQVREDMTDSFLSKDDEAVSRVVSHALTRKEKVLLARARDAELLIQPKSLTFADYPLNATQQDILTDIISYIQSYMTNDMAMLNPKLIGIINVPLKAGDYPTYGKHYKDFHDDLEKIWQHGKITFRWPESMINSPAAKKMFVDNTGKALFGPNSKVSTEVSLISGVTSDSTQPDLQVVTLNPLSLPFILYYGKGIGGTRYQKQLVFKLHKKYSKRLYPILMDYTTLPDRPHKMSLEDFRRRFDIPSCYDSTRIFKQIIRPSLEEINSVQDDFIFNCELTVENHISNGKKPKLDTVRFDINYRNDLRNVHQMNRQHVVATMRDFADRGMNEVVERATDIIFDKGQYEKYMSKVRYYSEQLKTYKIKSQEYKNIMLSIVLKLTGIDLRTPEHIRNAKNYKARMERKMKSIGKV